MQLRLMTWNIHKGIGMDRRFKLERIIDVIKHHEPDILLMQEVDRGVPRSRKLSLDLEIAAATGLPYHCWFQNHSLKLGGYGNATLSRFPIRRKRNVDLTIGRRKRRSSLYARIDMPGHWDDLHVFNWHLGLSAQERKQQVETLFASGTLKHLGRKARVVLGGDTNDWRNLLYEGAGIGERGFKCWAEDGKRKPPQTYPSIRPVGALDKFFWRGGFGDAHVHISRMQLARVASDHLPLLAELTLA